MSDAFNGDVSSCFFLPLLDCITATFTIIPRTEMDHTYIYPSRQASYTNITSWWA